MKILNVVGTRPQIIKAAAMSRVIDCEEVFIDTGQHWDDNMAGNFYKELGLDIPDICFDVGIFPYPDYQVADIIENVGAIIRNRKPDLTIVYGDTNSTLGATIGAKLAGCPVVHIEAGVRSGTDIPEEINRKMVDSVADLLLCPSADSLLNVDGVFVGDIMYDNVLFYKDRMTKPKYKDYALCTIHRQANMERLEAIFEGLKELPIQVVMPVHPRVKKVPDFITAIEPASYLEMLGLIYYADIVITDSGGVQRESHYLKTPCIVIRDETEWPELVECGTSMLSSPKMLDVFNTMLSWKEFEYPNFYGDGNAAELIWKAINDKFA